MAYEALARKYRPRTFEEVVGQEPIVRTLTNAIREKRIHHAYVFSGVRGVGKTTVARIFAKALNCEKGPTPTPCLECDPCREISAGRDLDVIEMDAASRTGVDDVRDLIDTTRYAPARDRYKVFIIDEFHMLSKPAFNALLKTLEEPPPRVVFLMATTELHKVLPTVLSRTQQFDFRKVPPLQIADQLAAIAKKEHVKAPRSCFEMLARAADGSVRDAESLLDQAIAFCGTELQDTEVRTLLGLVPDETVEAFLAACADQDAGALIRMIEGILAEGHDLRIFHAGLIEGARNLLVLRAAEASSDVLGLSREETERLSRLAERFSVETLLRLFSALTSLEAPLRYSDQPRYLLEAAAIRMAALADLTPVEDLIAWLEEGGQGPSPRTSSPSRTGGAGRAPARAPQAPTSAPHRAPLSKRPKGEAASGGADAIEDRDPEGEDIADIGADETAEGSPASLSGKCATTSKPVTSFRSGAAREDVAARGETEGSSTMDGPSLPIAEAPVVDGPDPGTPDPMAELGPESGGGGDGEQTAVASWALSRIRDAMPTRPGGRAQGPRAAGAGGPEVPEASRRITSAGAPSPSGSVTSAGVPDPSGLITRADPGPSGAIEGARGRLESAIGRVMAVNPGPPDPEKAPGGVKYQRLLAQALEDPIVKSVMERFGGRIVDVKEVP